jgi:hypothetical protein
LLSVIAYLSSYTVFRLFAAQPQTPVIACTFAG